MSQSVSLRPSFDCYRAIARHVGAPAAAPYGLVMMGVIAAMCEAAAVGLVVALLFGLLGQTPEGLVGRLLNLAPVEGWAGLAILLVLLVSAKAALSYAYTVNAVRFKNRLNAEVLTAVHARLLDLPYPQLRKHGAGDLLNVAATQAWEAANANYLLTRMSICAVMIGVFAVAIAALSWPMALLGLAGGVLIAVLGQSMAGAARNAGLAVRRHIESLYAQILAAVHGARLVRAFTAEAGEKRRFASRAQDLRGALVRSETLSSAIGPLNEVAYLLLLIAMVGLASMFDIAAASALTAIALVYRLGPHVRELEAHRLAFAGLYAPLQAVAALLEEAPRVAEPDRTRESAPGAVRFECVSFTPDGASAPALRDVSFEAPRGKVTALLGPSGAGKTSIVNLLLRLHEPSAGEILINGKPLRAIDRLAWLAGVAVAGQDIDVVEGTIADNLRLGRPDADLAALRDAARDAGALNFIDALPERFNSWIGSFGYNLSGGQRQRIALARAFLREPWLLLLDESTSAVEQGLEAEILANVRARCPEATILLITHRLNAAAHVDHVVQLEAGGVTAEYDWSGEPVLLRAQDKRS